MCIFPSYWQESVTLLLFSLGTDGKENSQYVNFIAYPMSIMSKCEYQDGGSQRSLNYISGFLFCKIMFLFFRSQRIASLKLKFLTWIIESRDTIWWKYYSDSQFCTVLIDHVQFNNETRNKAEVDKLQKMYPNGCHWEFFNILCGNIFIVFLYFLFSINLLYSEKNSLHSSNLRTKDQISASGEDW